MCIIINIINVDSLVNEALEFLSLQVSGELVGEKGFIYWAPVKGEACAGKWKPLKAAYWCTPRSEGFTSAFQESGKD